MEDFVNFSIAKKLKEKGFEYPCIGHYVNNQLYIAHYLNAFHSDKDESLDAPTISQVLKWLREEKNIFIEIALSPDGYQHIIYTGLYCMATSCAYHFTFDGFYQIEDNYITYEQAALAGIKEVLDNLI